MVTKVYTKEEIKENRKKWLDALRSDKYIQGYGALKRVFGGEMCAFGIGCEVSQVGNWEHKSYGTYFYNSLQKVLRFYGIPTSIERKSSIYVMIKWNDEERLNFQEYSNRLECFFEDIEKRKEEVNS